LLSGSSAASQAVIFGAVVAQVPSCFDTTEVPTDSYLGGRTQISNLNPGKFQLLLQVGGGAQPGASGTGTPGAAGSLAIDLPALATPSHIDAWASIVE
jgi:hypothetical protein